MQIRNAREDDAIVACEVLRRSIAELCHADHKGDPATLEGWLANKTPDNFRRWTQQSFVLVAVDGKAILGVAAMDRSGAVLLNYVSPDARFRGVSKALVTALEAQASALGLVRMTLLSTQTAHRFYLSQGYVPDGPPRRGFGVTLAQPMAKHLHASRAADKPAAS